MSVDPQSPTWATVKAFAEAEIEAARVALEQPAPADASNLHRGRIKALRDILALTIPAPTIQASGNLY